METLPQMLARNARLIGDKPFVHFEGSTLTYADLYRQARKIATILNEKGVKKGAPVGIFLPNGLELIKAFWACQIIGAAAVPMSNMLRGPEIRNIVRQTSMQTIFVDDEAMSVLQDVMADLKTLSHVIAIHGEKATTFWDAVGGAREFNGEVLFQRDDIATVFFTSGTTGVPKGAMQSHFAQYSAMRDMMVFNRWRYDQEVAYCALPLTNNMACTCIMNLCMFAGGTMIVERRWDTRRGLDAVKAFKVTFLVGPPTVYVYMVNEFVPARDDISSLRLCIAGGAPVPPEIIRRFEAISHGRVAHAYGATEVTCYVTADPIVGERRVGSAGLPIGSSRITIVDDDRAPVKSGETGEIFVQGDTVGIGYWGDPETTAKAFVGGGWLSGDIGRLDDDGYLYIVDRKKDLIISGGFNIYPIEVENLLYTHPAVKMCAVVGLPDNDKGEIPAAFIIRSDSNAKLDAAEITQFCRANLSAYKVPRRVYFVDDLPLSPVGKILKREIRRKIEAGELPT